MGISAIVGVISAVGTVYSAVQQQQAQKSAAADRRNSEDEQRKARDEQKAQQSAQAAQERRQQIRDERSRRARVLQSSDNTGVTGSSGSIGATGDLSTTLGGNIGSNLGAISAAGRISDLNQSAADFLSSSQSHIAQANQWGQMGSISQNIFSASGGFNTFSSEQAVGAPVETRTK